MAMDLSPCSTGQQITALAAKHRLPAMYNLLAFVDSGGLMAYAPDLAVHVPARSGLRRQDTQRCQACRPAHRAADSIRARRQPQDRQGPRADHPAVDPAAGRRGDPVNRRRVLLVLAGSDCGRARLATRARCGARAEGRAIGLRRPGLAFHRTAAGRYRILGTLARAGLDRRPEPHRRAALGGRSPRTSACAHGRGDRAQRRRNLYRKHAGRDRGQERDEHDPDRRHRDGRSRPLRGLWPAWPGPAAT